jgi:hypothetical protein
MKERGVRSIHWLFALCLIVGCEAKKTPEESVQTQAYRMIDHGQVDQAIELLSGEIRARDENHQPDGDHSEDTESLRVTLASAYFKMAGLEMKDVLRSVTEGSRINQLKPSLFSKNPDIDPKQGAFLDSIARNIFDFYKSVQWFSVLPVVGDDKIDILKYAVKILNTVRSKKPEDLIYKAIIKVIILNSSLTSRKFLAVLPPLVKEGAKCVAQCRDLKNYLLEFSDDVLSVMGDLVEALPERKDEFSVNVEIIQKYKADVVAVKDENIEVNSTSRMLFFEVLFRKFGATLDVETCTFAVSRN